MKRTNILVEVSDGIYDSVVTPHKKAKTFSKLIATLLKGYIENEYIRAYAEDTLDDMHKASVDALDEVIDNMQQSLVNMGLYAEELKDSTQEGMSYFGNKVEVSSAKESKDADDLRDDVEELKVQNAEILSMLKAFMESGATREVKVSEPVSKVVERPVEKPIETPVREVKEVKVPPIKEIKVETPPLKEISSSSETEDSSTKANDLLASLMVGNVYKF